MRADSIVLILIASVFFTSCATVQTYEGEELPPDKVAVIKSNYWGDLVVTAVVREVDGEDMGYSPGNIMVLPGKHSIKIRVTHSLGMLGLLIGHKTVELYAEAGHTYKVNGALIRNETWVWIVDEETEHIVVGRDPFPSKK